MQALQQDARPVDPLREARERVGGDYEVRVLEPSPPALVGNADDPTARGVVPPGARLLSPVSSGDVTWAELAVDDADLAAFARKRWLVPASLPAVPDRLAETRMSLHQVAERVVSPARRNATGNEISLRYTRGGFGTPFFADDRQVRVEGTSIVDQCNASAGGHLRREPIESLRGAAEVLGGLVEAGELPEDRLAIDETAAAFLGEWFGFGTLVIAELRAGAGEELEPATINLWPEHFDIATELGSEAAGQRAAIGASPGDDEHPEPYLYIAPWTAEIVEAGTQGVPAAAGEAAKPPQLVRGELWNATAFVGAELSYAELLATPEPVAAGVDFLETRLRALTEA